MKPLLLKSDIGYFAKCYDDYLKSEVANVISENDPMFWGVLWDEHHEAEGKYTEALLDEYQTNYYGFGQDAAHEVVTACMNSYLKRVDSVLDLACGYGRVTRHLVELFPDAKVFAADVICDGVAFCAEQFGVEGIHLPDDIGEYDFGHRYDVIWAGSLFTHHPRGRVKRWIAHMCNHLSDNGIFVFTTHGRRAFKKLKVEPNIEKGYLETGYGFHCPDHLDDAKGGGISVVDPAVLMADLKDIATVRVLSYRQAGWLEFQDVVSVGKPFWHHHQIYELPRPMELRRRKRDSWTEPTDLR